MQHRKQSNSNNNPDKSWIGSRVAVFLSCAYPYKVPDQATPVASQHRTEHASRRSACDRSNHCQPNSVDRNQHRKAALWRGTLGFYVLELTQIKPIGTDRHSSNQSPMRLQLIGGQPASTVVTTAHQNPRESKTALGRNALYDRCEKKGKASRGGKGRQRGGLHRYSYAGLHQTTPIVFLRGLGNHPLLPVLPRYRQDRRKEQRGNGDTKKKTSSNRRVSLADWCSCSSNKPSNP